jgi:hypothetical protein
MRRFWLVAATLGFVPLHTLGAQFQLSADVGSAVLRQTGLPESAVLTAGADLRWTGARAALTSSALAATAADGRGTGQVLVTGALHAAPGHRARWQVAGTVSTFGLTNDLPTVSTQLTVREYVGNSARGVFLGGGGAEIVRNHLWRPALVAQSGAWWRRRSDQLVATLAATSTVAEQHQNYPGYGDYVVTSSAAYVDLSSGWQREGRTYTFALTGGARAGLRGVTPFDGWVSATAEGWVAPRVALVGAAGRALGDVVRGVPPTRYATIALRVTLQPRAGTMRRPVSPLPRGAHLVVGRAIDSASRAIEVRVDTASSVEIMADFTGWEPVALTRANANGVWRVERAIESGPHRIAIRIDGGEWAVPVNLPRVDNGFGGTVGVITVP